MNNGITFGTKNSITDWDLLMTSKKIGEAEPIINLIEIPGRNGTLDLSEAFGEVKYKDRNLEFEFDMFDNHSQWWSKKKQISNYLNGQKLKVTLDQDPNYYYYARLKVDDFSNNKSVASIKISGIADPYKYKQNKTISTKTVSSGNSYTYTNSRMKAIPTLTLSANMTLTYKGNSYSLSAGTQKVLDIQFEEGINTIVVTTGSGTLTVEWQEGDL